MFNKWKIESLEQKIKWLQEDKRELSNLIWSLEKDLNKLTRYLGVEFKDEERTLVARPKSTAISS